MVQRCGSRLAPPRLAHLLQLSVNLLEFVAFGRVICFRVHVNGMTTTDTDWVTRDEALSSQT